jgi:hypothetical protein
LAYLPAGATRFRSRQGFRSKPRYWSQGKDAHSRTIENCHRIAAKVLRAGPPEWRAKYQDWDFPPKPPWMRWTTYTCHLTRWEQLEALGEAYLAQLVGKLGGI